MLDLTPENKYVRIQYINLLLAQQKFREALDVYKRQTDTLTMIPFLQSFSSRYDRLAHTAVSYTHLNAVP